MKVAIRLATADDADVVSDLLSELGYSITSPRIAASLRAMNSANDPVFVAVGTEAIVGLAALHIAHWLHLEQPIARITAFIVQKKYQRRGIGRQLLEHAVAAARDAGCGTVELTTAVERSEARAFYRELGFEETSVRFKKALI